MRLFYRVDTCNYWCKRQLTREAPCYRLKRTRVTMRWTESWITDYGIPRDWNFFIDLRHFLRSTMEIRGATRENKRFTRDRVIGKTSSGKFPANFSNRLKFIASFFWLEEKEEKNWKFLEFSEDIYIREFIILNYA